MIYLLISSVIFISYVTYCLCKYNLTKSISITYYKHDVGDRWLFIVFMLSFSSCLAIQAEDWLFYVSAGFAWITGLAADFQRNKLLRVTHVGAAYLMIITAGIGLWYHYGLWELTITGAVGTASLMIPQVNRRIWLAEVWWFIVISFGVYHAVEMGNI